MFGNPDSEVHGAFEPNSYLFSFWVSGSASSHSNNHCNGHCNAHKNHLEVVLSNGKNHQNDIFHWSVENIPNSKIFLEIS